MPTPDRSAFPPALTRRSALAGLVVAASTTWAGCTADSGRERAPRKKDTADSPAPDPDVILAGLAVSREQQMLDALDATVQRHPELASLLGSAQTTHRAHIELMDEAAPDEAPSPSESALDGPSGSASGEPSDEPSDEPTTGGTATITVPAGRGKALALLAAEEQDLSTALRRHAFVAQSGQFARLLASMSAAAGQHAAVLSVAEPPRRQAPR